jgi:putative nucleotidyltransferase with HDIG domain
MKHPTTNITIPTALREFARINAPESLFGTPTPFGLGAKTQHTWNVKSIALQVAKKYPGINLELLGYCADLHDIGRRPQYDTLKNGGIGCFNDRKVDHHHLGAQMLDAYLMQHNLGCIKVWRILRDVIEYHGKKNLWFFADQASIPYLKIISEADDIENGCLGALGYLEHELKIDAKGYKDNHPERDQRDLNAELLGYLERGEWFDKMKYCTTYAEYFVFAATLAVKSCNQFASIAKKAMTLPVYEDENGNMLDAVDSYCHIFRRYLHHEDAEIACRIMREKCR